MKKKRRIRCLENCVSDLCDDVRALQKLIKKDDVLTVETVENYEKKLREGEENPTTTITVWGAYSPYTAQHGVMLGWKIKDYINVKEYTFKGTPDINRVTKETLDKGALAIKVMCTIPFEFACYSRYETCYLWNTDIGTINKCGNMHKSYYATTASEQKDVADTDIEAAITAYLAGQNLASKNEAKQGFKERGKR